MSETPRDTTGGDAPYAPGDDPTQPDVHRHGDTVHAHRHAGPHEHGDDLEYDEAHDPDAREQRHGPRPPDRAP